MPLESRHLTPADYRVMPWKNGQGTTTEIAAFPPGAGLDAFTWRISIADITSSGPFSSFPGIDRILLQTAGEPMTLVHQDDVLPTACRLTLLSPVRFPGERVIHGDVPTPPVRDFNVMTRRDRAFASVAVHQLATGSTVRTQGPATARILHALQGSLTIRLTPTAPIALTAPTAPTAPATILTLSEGETWLLTATMEDDTSFELSSPSLSSSSSSSLTTAVAIAITVTEWSPAASPAVD